jgi:hypothetical protein
VPPDQERARQITDRLVLIMRPVLGRRPARPRFLLDNHLGQHIARRW